MIEKSDTWRLWGKLYIPSCKYMPTLSLPSGGVAIVQTAESMERWNNWTQEVLPQNQGIRRIYLQINFVTLNSTVYTPLKTKWNHDFKMLNMQPKKMEKSKDTIGRCFLTNKDNNKKNTSIAASIHLRSGVISGTKLPRCWKHFWSWQCCWYGGGFAA